ncbi:BadF/BadG/BcrA/BcrD ATPase family protein [Allomeiothermus silvanus]|uniref:BadF/BadG/BcrA/BcrD ATPase family protein n=1 Tax=Allomeiothermus silvanus TaxID=52022 RepID=UPI0023F3C46A|nr:BadF/BadG/BcrA/BcrD ATPase family protein [Allomeiothermus silvanus]
MTLVLGIDGGQTSTRAAVADLQGRVLARAQAGPWDDLSTEEKRQRCRAVLEELLRQIGAQLPLVKGHRPPASAGTQEPIRYAALGLTGAQRGSPVVEAWMRELLPGLVSLAIHHDTQSNFRGADPYGNPGVLVIAGGGSIAWGFDVAGREAFAGGYGYLLGDVGSGYELGRQAVRAVLEASQLLGPATHLTQALLAHLRLGQPWDLRMAFYDGRLERQQVAGLLPVVARVAGEGDKVAQRILREGGAALAGLAGAVMRQLEFWDPAVYPTGGVFRVGLLREAFMQALARLAPRAVVRPPRLEPLGGALVLALEQAGPIHPGQIAGLEQALPYADA